jgi:hypothetical protein
MNGEEEGRKDPAVKEVLQTPSGLRISSCIEVHLKEHGRFPLGF